MNTPGIYLSHDSSNMYGVFPPQNIGLKGAPQNLFCGERRRSETGRTSGQVGPKSPSGACADEARCSGKEDGWCFGAARFPFPPATEL